MDSSDDGLMPRFHPLIAKYNNVVAWWICDGHDQPRHGLPKPYVAEPCTDYDEALELCAILNEENA